MAKTAFDVSFEAPVERIGDRTLLRLPAAASAELPSRGQVAAVGSINSQAFETVIEPDGLRGHWIRIDDELLKRLALADGDTAAVELEPADAWPEPAIPEDLRTALSDAPDLDTTWESLTPMARWEWVRWVEATKNPQTRERRVEVSISKLQDGKRRPCCFDLSACTDPEVSTSGKLVAAA